MTEGNRVRRCGTVLLLAALLLGTGGKGLASDVPPVVIDYFYEAGCPDCGRVRDLVLPELQERFEGFYTLRWHDIGEKNNVIMLVAYQEKLGITENKSVCMVVDYRYVFNGFDAIKGGLFQKVDDCVAERLGEGWRPPEPIQVRSVDGVALAQERVRRFTLSAVVTAGLMDGINPCAISSLVFLMSLLAVAKVRGGGLLLMGMCFCLASFVTYTAIGFGLLRLLYLFTGLPLLRFGVEMILVAVLGLLAYLSFRDAYLYRKTGQAEDVTLQLPDRIKSRIHRIMGVEIGVGREAGAASQGAEGVGKRGWLRLIIVGCVVGTAVTALESICTGQVYVPTLVLVAKSADEMASRAWTYLLLYNAMFIVPLVAVFVLTYFGLRTQTLLAWSKRNVVVGKALLGLFFLAMAILVIWL